jgi:hypothetical protein
MREVDVKSEPKGTSSVQNCGVVTEVRDFAELDECERVIASYERCREMHGHKVGDGFFDFRVLWINSFPAAENETRRILQSWRRRAVEVLRQSAGVPLYSDTVQVVRWTGQAMPPHQDDQHPHGRPHKTPWRKWASIIYLNDDFDGGEIYFPESANVYRPIAGALIFFEGCRWHGVRAVTRGIRYTSPSWYSIDSTHEDRYAHAEY